MPTRDATRVSTEEAIFEAAQAVFHEHGFDGARMQEIARRAGINHSMLHYYYRSKGRLFEAVFQKAAMALIPPALEALRSDLPLLEKLDAFVEGYLRMIRANPHLPAFVLQELRRNPDALKAIVGEATAGVFEPLRLQINEEIREGRVRPVAPEHLLANVFALCVFPFIAEPMLASALGMGDEAYDLFLEERNQQVKSFLRGALQP